MKQIEVGSLNAIRGKRDTFEDIFNAVTKGKQRKKEEEETL
jgi:hypothetical protein